MPLVDCPRELLEWLAIPSVRALPGHRVDVVRAGRWICDFMAGCGTWRLDEHGPLVLGSVSASAANAPTVLVYGHFDVQPAGDEALWDSPPFAPEIRGDWLYGRGTADSKANSYVLLSAIRSLARADRLPVNITAVFDGAEEVDGTAAPEYATAPALTPAAAIVWDGSMFDRDTPAFYVSSRGTIAYDVRVTTSERDLHSGIYGGYAMNAVHALMAALAPVLSDSFAGPAMAASADERRQWRVPELVGVVRRPGAVFQERTQLGTSVDVTGIEGGYPGLHSAVVPARARARVAIRVGPGVDPAAADASFRRAVADAMPPGASLEIACESSVAPAQTLADSRPLRLAADAFERVLGVRPLLLRAGATIPIAAALASRGISTIMTGLALPESCGHAPNERFLVAHLDLGIELARSLLTSLGDL